MHDEEADKAKEKAKERESGGGGSELSGMVVMPPALRREVKWLVTTFWRAVYLPVMDVNLTSRNGVDAFGQVSGRRSSSPIIAGCRPSCLSFVNGVAHHLHRPVVRSIASAVRSLETGGIGGARGRRGRRSSEMTRAARRAAMSDALHNDDDEDEELSAV